MATDSSRLGRTGLPTPGRHAPSGLLQVACGGPRRGRAAMPPRVRGGGVPEGRGLSAILSQLEAPVGCGALPLLESGTAELKRMYIAPPLRGRKLGCRLLE